MYLAAWKQQGKLNKQNPWKWKYFEEEREKEK